MGLAWFGMAASVTPDPSVNAKTCLTICTGVFIDGCDKDRNQIRKSLIFWSFWEEQLGWF
jgi:hypothetical protein